MPYRKDDHGASAAHRFTRFGLIGALSRRLSVAFEPSTQSVKHYQRMNDMTDNP